METPCYCTTEQRERNWLWSDCEIKGHESGCYVVWCRVCDVWNSDCRDAWRPMMEEWVS